MNIFKLTIINPIFNAIHRSTITRRLASTYKSAVITEHGKPLEIQEVKQPKLGPSQVRVQVDYCSVNSVDNYKFKQSTGELPFTPGYELSGEVLEVGKDIRGDQISIGEKVVGLNLERFSGLAEQCVLDIDDIFRIPAEVTTKDAAVIAYGHSLALYAFSKLSNIKEKDQVVITAAAAGLGLAAVDVAANIYKAEVIAVVEREELGDLLRDRGAFRTVHFSPKFNKEIMKETKNKGAKVVYDAAGDPMMKVIGQSVSVGGKTFYCAPFFYENIPSPVPHSFSSIVSLKHLRRQNKNLYRTVVSDTLELANESLIGAHISAKFQLDKINEALKFIEHLKCTGKILIKMDD
ncbi:quinone oxidoreductase-like protein 2 [Anthonomus grandis grandis]|uniref:quinone oxidoreductase-like protein 2 n=1 Tax=Anthonomus grandis grandis TaxID=2921223 RepID=UPI0021663A42|nr:quinone oxidoreductase-like protein 2 [Anthonomus grandis grandis]